MKKLILITSILLGSRTIHTQTLTFKFGPTFSKMSYEGWSDLELYQSIFGIRTGYIASVGLDFLEKKHFNLSTNLSFMTVGGRGEHQSTYPGGGIDEFRYHVSLNYLTLGAKAFFKYPYKENKNLFVGLGPRVDFLQSIRENKEWFKPFEEDKEFELINYILSLELGFGGKIDEQLSYKVSGEFNLNKPLLLKKEYEWDNWNDTGKFYEKSELKFCSIFSFSLGFKL